jgi:hypothetical protein
MPAGLVGKAKRFGAELELLARKPLKRRVASRQ